MIDTDLRAFLVALATGAGDRIFVGNAEVGAPQPFVILKRNGGSVPRTLSGAALFSRTQFSVDVITADYPSAYPIAFAIRDALDGFVGTLGATPVQSARCISFPTDQSLVDGDVVTRWVAMEFLFVHSEA
jgi:hypothetical protein